VDAEVREGGNVAAKAYDHQSLACEADWEGPVGQLAALADGHPGGAERLIEGRLAGSI
jgi:hypothetical protein